MHRIPHDEVFHLYAGESVEMLLLSEDGAVKILTLGQNYAASDLSQVVVPAGTWQGTKLSANAASYALMETTVAPGFEFSDLVIASRSELIAKYPAHRDLIEAYTHL